MPTQGVTGYLSPDEAERFETYCQEHGLSKSQGARRLICEGLDETGVTHPLSVRARGAIETAGVLSMGLALASVVVGVGGFASGLVTGHGFDTAWIVTLIISAGLFTIVSLLFGIAIMAGVPDRLPGRRAVATDGGGE